MLYEHVQAAGVRRLAMIGLAKHAGKTTALNTIIEEASQAGVSLSLQSIGVDGERFDSLIGVAKPAVQAPAGGLIATAADALEQATAKLELLEATGVPSALGEIFIARVTEPGSVLLAGVRQVEQAGTLLAKLEKWGARLHLIDGAFDRMASATPDLVDAIVLCAGASVGRTIVDVARETRAALARLQLPPVEQEWERELAALARTTACIAAGGPGMEPKVLSGVNPLLLHPRSIPDWPEDAVAVAVPGVVTDRLLEMWEGLVQTVILRDGTHMMGTLAGWKRFARKGGRLLAERAIRIVAVTVNSVSVEGYRLPRHELLDAIQQIAGGLPVVDCLFSRQGGGQ
ncbi:lysine 5,6-aminomutase reactivase subunit KamB [Effusibacillus pohliae]|uniref:lysine 5,6-aminomutase reactivase subunit KamB n=1 Tax=Effusibacillus pohliae TaxID=232270 RepID=UPI00035E3455|nr:hypothetical protein [Effusibacillus pohliae]